MDKTTKVEIQSVCWPTFWLNFWNFAPREDHMRRPIWLSHREPWLPWGKRNDTRTSAPSIWGGNCRGTSKELGKLISKFSYDTVNKLDYILFKLQSAYNVYTYKVIVNKILSHLSTYPCYTGDFHFGQWRKIAWINEPAKDEKLKGTSKQRKIDLSQTLNVPSVFNQTTVYCNYIFSLNKPNVCVNIPSIKSILVEWGI